MSNKKGVTLTKKWSEKLQKICEKAHQNQLNLQSFYRTNKLKFPPLLQSKNIILNNLNKSISQQQVSQMERQQTKNEENSILTRSDQNQSLTKSRPSICPIVFKNIKGRKYSVVHANNSNSPKPFSSKTIEIDRAVSKTISKNSDKKTLRFINQGYNTKNSLSTLFNSFYTNRSFLDQNPLGSNKNSKDSNENLWRSQLNQSLLVNNAVAVSPECLFLQSLNRSRTDLLGVEKELIVKRNSRLDTKRISIYKNANGIVHGKKKTTQKIKQLGKFQPWPMTNPEDQMQEMGFPEMKSSKL